MDASSWLELPTCALFKSFFKIYISFQINGQNVVGVKDKEIAKIIDDGGQTVTITVIPTYLFDHMIKK